jgi:hypothetical protein
LEVVVAPNINPAISIIQEGTKRLVDLANGLLDVAGIGNLQVPPHPLYHYTTAIGLEGIVRSKRIWATYTDYLNDTSEISYGRNMAIEIMRGMESELTGDVIPCTPSALFSAPSKLIADAPIEKLAPWILLKSLGHSLLTHKEREYYVTSFCESGDLLSQWRGYGNYGGGYAIGIKVKESEFKVDNSHSYELINLLYDETKQRTLLKQLIDGVIAELQTRLPQIGGKENLTEQNPHFTAIVDDADSIFRRVTIRFKSPGFAEEKEWRFISGIPTIQVNGVETNQVNGVKFRDAKGILIPYIELNTDLPAIEIVSIHCGPTLHPELSARSVGMLLAQHGLQHVDVINSTTPFKL